MKKVKRSGKLTLSKETLRWLDDNLVKDVRGGARTDVFCPTINSYTCGSTCDNSFNVCCA